MHHFKNLKIWQKARVVVRDVYEVTSNFPDSEKFALSSQLRRCSVSIPSNFAEGAGRGSDGDFADFLSFSIGSSFELETQLIIAKDLELVSDENYRHMISEIEEIQRMLIGFRNKIVGKTSV
ncbi:MAG TPA: four helix bundle protein [Balneolales bacterium]|nr:four helix bundle protein [Balneolales bacterium]